MEDAVFDEVAGCEDVGGDFIVEVARVAVEIVEVEGSSVVVGVAAYGADCWGESGEEG